MAALKKLEERRVHRGRGEGSGEGRDGERRGENAVREGGRVESREREP